MALAEHFFEVGEKILVERLGDLGVSKLRPIQGYAGVHCCNLFLGRGELDISAVSAGMWVELDGDTVSEIRLCYGGMAATTQRAQKAEAVLRGARWTEPRIEQAIAALQQDFTPLSDQRGSAWFRQTLAANLLRGFYLETQATQQPQLSSRSIGTVCVEATP